MWRLIALLIAVLVGTPHGCSTDEPPPPDSPPPAEEVGTLLSSWDQYDAPAEEFQALLEPATRGKHQLLIQTA